MDHFGHKSFQAIDCTDTENQTTTKMKWLHTKQLTHTQINGPQKKQKRSKTYSYLTMLTPWLRQKQVLVYCLVSNYGTTTDKTKLKRCKFKTSVAKHQACFTTKLQGKNLATFSHSAVTPIAYLQHTVNTYKTCVNNALIMH